MTRDVGDSGDWTAPPRYPLIRILKGLAHAIPKVSQPDQPVITAQPTQIANQNRDRWPYIRCRNRQNQTRILHFLFAVKIIRLQKYLY